MIEFGIKRVFEPDIFGSWVIWMWELCGVPAFEREWYGRTPEENIEYNYIEPFRDLIRAGIFYHKGAHEDLRDGPCEPTEVSPDDRMRAFARYAAHHFVEPVTEGDPNDFVTRWLGQKNACRRTFNISDKKKYVKYVKDLREFGSTSSADPT